MRCWGEEEDWGRLKKNEEKLGGGVRKRGVGGEKNEIK